MLDEKDLQAIAQLMSQQKQEIIGDLDTKLAQQKKEILKESSANMRMPKSRVEQLEEEVEFLKTVIRSLSRDVAELKKAQ